VGCIFLLNSITPAAIFLLSWYLRYPYITSLIIVVLHVAISHICPVSYQHYCSFTIMEKWARKLIMLILLLALK
jgi:hypothetical protein